MKIAIDLNDVIRDYSVNFLKYYVEGYNHDFNLDDFEFWTNDYSALFPFKTTASYNNFVYNDYSFELFGKCGMCSTRLDAELNNWTEKTVKEMDTNEEIELMFVSTMEYGPSIGYSYYFLSKMGTKIREVYFPKDSSTIWDKCDVLITANPSLLNNKPEGKKSIKINTEYNKECIADYSFSNFSSFLKDSENTKKLLN